MEPFDRSSAPHTARWAVALGLTLLVGVMPQFLLGALGPQLRADLGLGAADVGLVFSMLTGSAVLIAPLLGWGIDRTGGRAGAIALLSLSGAALLLASFATSRTTLLVAFVPAGLAMAAANPATNRWAAAAEPARLQAFLVGVGQASVSAGALCAGLLAAAVAVGLDWRGALRIAAGVALLGILVASRSPGDGPGTVSRRGAARGGRGTPAARGTAPDDPAMRTRRRIQRALAGYAVLMGGGTALVLTYLPTYAVDRIGLGVAAAGATAVVYGSVAILTRLGLSGALRAPDRVLALVLTVLALGAAAAVTLIVLAEGRGPALLWAGTLLFGATGSAWPMVAFLGVVRASPPGRAGVVTGWVTAAFYTGLWATPLIGGLLVAGPGYRALWALAAACALLAIVPAVRTSALRDLTSALREPAGGAQPEGAAPAAVTSATATAPRSSSV
jgi:predicted MFS family arabinose efflux permease